MFFNVTFKKLFTYILTIFIIFSLIPGYTLNDKLSPPTLFKLDWLTEHKFMADYIYGHVEYLYNLQKDENITDGTKLQKRYHIILEENHLLNKKPDILDLIQWDFVKEGYFPFKYHTKTSDDSLTWCHYAINFYPDNNPPQKTRSILHHQKANNDTSFEILRLFNKYHFFDTVQNMKLEEQVTYFSKLLDSNNIDFVQNVDTAEEAMLLLWAVSDSRPALIFYQLDPSLQKLMIQLFSSDTLGPIFFGFLKLGQREAIQRFLEEMKEEINKKQNAIDLLDAEIKSLNSRLDNADFQKILKHTLPEKIESLTSQIEDYEEKLKLDILDIGIKKYKKIAQQSIKELPYQISETISPEGKKKLKEKLLAQLPPDAPIPENIDQIVEKISSQNFALLTKQLRISALMLDDIEKGKFKEKISKTPEVLQNIINEGQNQKGEWEEKRDKAKKELDEANKTLKTLETAPETIIAEERKKIEEEIMYKNKDIQDLEAEKEKLENKGIDPAASWEPAEANLNALLQEWFRILTKDPYFMADAITRRGKGKDKNPEGKLKAIQSFYEQMVNIWALEKNGVISDFTDKVWKKDMPQVIEIEKAEDIALRKMISPSPDQNKAFIIDHYKHPLIDIAGAIANRALNDKRLPLDHKNYRVYKLNIEKVQKTPPNVFIDSLTNMLETLSSINNILLVIDFNEIAETWYNEKEVLNKILALIFTKLETSKVDVIGYGERKTYNQISDIEPFNKIFGTPETFNMTSNEVRQFFILSIDRLQKDINISFPSTTVDLIIRTMNKLYKGKGYNFTKMVEIVNAIGNYAAKIQLKRRTISMRQTFLTTQDIQNVLDLFDPDKASDIDKDVDDLLSDAPEYKSEADFFQNDLNKRIKNPLFPEHVKKEVQRLINKLKKTNPQSAEYDKHRTALEIIMGIGWEKLSTETQDTKAVRRKLDEDHYGMDIVKRKIVNWTRLINRKQKASIIKKKKPNNKKRAKGKILCLVGPPGVGKTSIGQSIANATGREFARIALGGVRDEADIRGHRRTYVGALPGRIVDALIETGTMNPVLMLDEIDKLGESPQGNPASALLEVLDPSQNHAFQDHFLGEKAKIDLTKIIFIATANYPEKIPPALYDRMNVIHLDGYSIDDKIKIAKEFIFQKVFDEYEITEEDYEFENDNVLKYLVETYTFEQGVRDLEKRLGEIAEEIVAEQDEQKIKKVIITKNKIDKWMALAGIHKINLRIDSLEPEIGLTYGLAYTIRGGKV
ncbi:hypothetical protein BVX93_02390, partial [bacterium B13(2017)]